MKRLIAFYYMSKTFWSGGSIMYKCHAKAGKGITFLGEGMPFYDHVHLEGYSVEYVLGQRKVGFIEDRVIGEVKLDEKNS